MVQSSPIQHIAEARRTATANGWVTVRFRTVFPNLFDVRTP